MTKLHVSNGYQADLPGLGGVSPLSTLSQKRVTTAVRSHLRKRHRDVEVACKAEWHLCEWRGKCNVSGQELQYSVSSR